MQYALLGDLQFELLAYFNGLEGRLGSDYSEHARIEGKPRLQWIGDRLDEWVIKLKFHERYCDPEQELTGLKEAAASHAPLQFVLASGEYKGDFVITDLAIIAEHTDTLGRLISVEATLNLKEYVEPASATGMANKLAAPAVMAAGKLLPPSAQKLISSVGAISQVRRALSQASRAAGEAVTAYRTAAELTTIAKRFGSDPLGAIERLGRTASALAKLESAAGRLGSSLAPVQNSHQDAGPIVSTAGAIATDASQASSLLTGLTTSNVSSRIGAMESTLARVDDGLASASPALSRLAGRVTLRGIA